MKNSVKPIKSGPFYRVFEERIELFWEDVGTFTILENGEILVDAKAGVSNERIEVYKSGSPYTTSLFMQGYLVMHGSCLKIDDKVCGFLGYSGMGKSTTARAFMKHGATLLSDDFLAFKNIHESTEMLPGLAQMRLWEDALEHFGKEGTEEVQIHPEHKKYSLKPQGKASQEAKHLDALFILDYGEESELIPLQGFKALEQVFAQFKPLFYLHGKREQQSFLQLGALVNKVPVSKLVRKKGLENLDAVVELVRASLKG